MIRQEFIMKNWILIVMAVTLISHHLSAQQSGLSWLDGVWEGQGYQLSSGGTWAVKFTGLSGTNNYSIEYPSLKCGGNWMIISGNEHRAEFVEVISFGTDVCANGGIVVLTGWMNGISLSRIFHPTAGLTRFQR
jgi:hypothetical protein